MALTFRPHHFLCALCFQGKGYTPQFIANFTAIMQELNQPGGDENAIRVTKVTDSICAPCPSRRETLCTSQDTITTLDNAHAAILGLHDKDILTWGRAKQLLAEKMSLDLFHSACAPCAWKKLGICEKVLTQFQQS